MVDGNGHDHLVAVHDGWKGTLATFPGQWVSANEGGNDVCCKNERSETLEILPLRELLSRVG